MEVEILNMDGKAVGTTELPSTIFEQKINRDLMHQALVRQLANARAGTHSVLSRGEVRRTGAKWYRQKGTGRARHGSRRAPIFVGGGVAHGPKQRSYEKDMPRKMRRAALRSALSVKAGSNDIMVFDHLELDAPKTATVANLVREHAGGGSVLFILADPSQGFGMSVKNLDRVTALSAKYLNIRDLLGHQKVVLSKSSLELVENLLTDKNGRQAAESERGEE